MFSSGSVKVLGVLCALGSVVVALSAYSIRQDEIMGRSSLWMYGMSALSAVIASACLIEKGRAVTGRITAAVGCLVCLGIGVASAFSMMSGEVRESTLSIPLNDEQTLVIGGNRVGAIGMFFLIVVLGLCCAYYAVFGRFPSEWTFDELFRWPSSPVRKSKSKSKSAATRKAKKPLRPLDG